MSTLAGICRVVLLVVLGCHVCQGWFFSSFLKRAHSRPECITSPPLGCFPTQYPHNNTAGLQPQSPQAQGVKFVLHGRDGRRDVFSYDNSDEILRTKYVPTYKTVVLIHGWHEHAFVAWIRHMVEALFAKEAQVNVLVVDWAGGAGQYMYPQSAANTRVTGALLGLLLRDMISQGASASNMHLIGFSLGAHVAGHAGKSVQGLGRITGLDPAAPNFRLTHRDARLSSGDAAVVDVYHTDSHPVTGLGMSESVGTSDFYINSGMEQPGCEHRILNRIAGMLRGINTGAAARRHWAAAVACSHVRAPEFFISTINDACRVRPVQNCHDAPSVYIGLCEPCQGHCPVAGYGFVQGRFGNVFNVQTGANYPYCYVNDAPPVVPAVERVNNRWPIPFRTIQWPVPFRN